MPISKKIPLGRKDKALYDYTLEELFQDSLLSTPAVSVTTDHPVSEATGLLPYHLESFTDSLVVTEGEEPVGIVGGFEILKGLLENPHYRFFEQTRMHDIANKDLLIVTPKTRLSELIKRWIQTRRAFALVPNQYHGYSVISSRKMLEIGITCRIRIKLSELPMKKVVTFRRDNSVGYMIKSMFDSKTRKLVLNGTSQFISDRIIIQKIVRELGFLQGIENFLDMRAEIFRLGEARVVSEDLAVWQACDMMYHMQSPYLLIKDNALSPWDVVMVLSSGM